MRRPRPRYRGVCAICDGTNDTTQICRECRADPVNAGWIETWEDEVEQPEQLPAGQRLADVQERPIRPVTELQRIIIDMALRGEMVTYVYRDRKGRRRGTRKRCEQLSYSEIARRLGCSKTYVATIVRAQLK